VVTGQQAKWLREHRGWEAVGRGHKYTQRQMLHADGTSEEVRRGFRLIIRPGSFEVGIRDTGPRGTER
jgi:hypothetical protein